MKTLISLLTLVAIALIYLLSVGLYVQNDLFPAYVLFLASLISLTFWIRQIGMLQEERA
jgi:hypothetical protein